MKKVLSWGWSEGAPLSSFMAWATVPREEPWEKAKPVDMPQRLVWEASKRVTANQGTAGVDGQSMAAFAEDVTNNLYQLWNRRSSGSDVPPPVKRGESKTRSGGTRPFGVPTGTDRIAQAVVKTSLEPEWEQHVHPDS